MHRPLRTIMLSCLLALSFANLPVPASAESGGELIETKTVVLSSSNPTQPGQTVTLTAHVTGRSGTPVGGVTFKEGDNTLATVNLDGSANATFTTAPLTAGFHRYNALYGGNAIFRASHSETFVEIVQKSCADAFSDATEISGRAGAIIGTTGLATGETGEPDPTGNSQPFHSVWCKWTAPTTGEVTFGTYGSRYDTTLGVYTGDAINTLTLVAANDNVLDDDGHHDGSGSSEAGEAKLSRVTFNATQGTVYKIVIGGANGAKGDYVLNWHQEDHERHDGLLAAVLPTARSAVVGVASTAFATIINTTDTAATGCNIQLPPGYPADIFYQSTNLKNEVLGTQDTPVDIPPHSAQGFVFGVTPNAPLSSGDIALVFTCSNIGPAPSIPGVNTLKLTADQLPNADIVAISASLTRDGILSVPKGTTGVVGAAAINIGASAAITVSADDDSHKLPLTVTLCRSDPSTGACVTPATPAATTTSTLATNEVATYSIFVTVSDTIPFEPAKARVFIRFKTADGVLRGATSVAVRTP